MARTLLLSDPSRTWKQWLKSNLGKRDFICLDPEDIAQAPPGRLTLHRGERTVEWSFYGALDSQRAPHVLLAGLHRLLSHAGDDVVVQLPAYRPNPLAMQFLRLAAEAIHPQEAFLAGRALHMRDLAPSIIETELEAAFDEDLRKSQRKAHWMKLIEACSPHEIYFDSVAIEGVRLGAGTPVDEPIQGATYAEACGSTLLIASGAPLEDEAVAKALDLSHCARAVIVAANAYDGLLCAFSNHSGECFGMGVIQSADFVRRSFQILSTAIAPAPVRLLRIGGLRLSMDGDELEEVRPWQV